MKIKELKAISSYFFVHPATICKIFVNKTKKDKVTYSDLNINLQS